MHRRLLLSICTVISFTSALNPLSLAKDIEEGGKIWAVLVAGSKDYINYRHQADVCHAYHILHNHGIPDERIIVMMYDDIAHNPSNPTPGTIINHPKGKDVYKGVPMDYTGHAVTPSNFLSVLQGNQEAVKGVGSGKVVKSGSKDHIFVYFSDHGSPGLIAFPKSQLYADSFSKVLVQMHKENKFQKMVIYLEACFSGSMFKNFLPKNINVYAMTAANTNEESYSCYFDNFRQVYLGDVFSVKWMEDSDQEDLSKDTLGNQFQKVQEETNTSHVSAFGDLTFESLSLSSFQGRKKHASESLPKMPFDAVSNRDVPVLLLKKRIESSNDSAVKERLQKDLERVTSQREFLKSKLRHIVENSVTDPERVDSVLTTRADIKNMDCYRKSVRYFHEHCFDISQNSYALGELHVFVNLCEHGISLDGIRSSMDLVCFDSLLSGIN